MEQVSYDANFPSATFQWRMFSMARVFYDASILQRASFPWGEFSMMRLFHGVSFSVTITAYVSRM
jgi:hypothetical protein